MEAYAFPTNDANVVIKFLKKNIFTRFGTPKAIINNEGSHFYNEAFKTLLVKYGVKHKITTPYHLQTRGQAKISNCEIKRILEKVVSPSRKDWSPKLDDALWTYRIVFKTLIGMSPYRLVIGKTCHLPFKLESKACWVIQKMNIDAKACGERWWLELNELDDLRVNAYENVKLYKERTKLWHDRHLWGSQFKPRH